MMVFKNTDDLPRFDKAVITIGTFDGVHPGHLKIIEQLIGEAEATNGTPVLITFFPHPKQVIPLEKKPIFILTTPAEKYELLGRSGIHNIVEVPFTDSFASQSATDYIKDFLVAKFHPHTIIIGYDHRFGKNREGDYHLLEDEAAASGYVVKEIPERLLQDVAISSTRIREALHAGEIEAANELLGYEYFFSGTVVEGNKLGRTLGYPTANLQVEVEKLIPANGVYAVDVEVGASSLYKGMMNIGVRPTVEGTVRVIEINIFNFDEDIYGRELKVYLKKRLRSEIKFPGIDALKEQLAKDRAIALAL